MRRGSRILAPEVGMGLRVVGAGLGRMGTASLNAGLARSLTLPSGLVLPNRIAKASTSESLAERGDPTARLERLYRTWSEGGAGLVLTGNAMVTRRYRERMGNVVLDDKTDRAALARYAAAAKTAGNAALVQISHPGRQVMRHVASDPVAPSAGPAVNIPGAFARPRALREDEIESILDAFALAAGMVVEAGFDGVQVHAAHGYLASQFLSPRVNHREDRWGGSLENRARFLLEAVRRVRAKIGAGKTLAVKLNSSDFQKGGFTPEEAFDVVAMLETAGIDLLELSGGNYESLALLGLDAKVSTRTREAYFLEYARTARTRTKVPIMLTGGFRSRAVMEAAIDEGAIDVAGLARPICFEPDLPKRLLSGACARAEPFERPKASLELLEGAAETGYYVQQIARIADGKAPSRDIGVNAAAIAYVTSDASLGLRRALFGE